MNASSDQNIIHRLASIETRMQGINERQEQTSADIRRISDKMSDIALIAQSSHDNSESIRRLWAAIESKDDTLLKVARQADRTVNIATGIGLCIGIIVGLVVFIYLRDTARLDSTVQRADERLDAIEIFIAPQGYKR